MHIHLMKNFNRFLFAFFQATETMEDLKRKIQCHERIPIGLQIISFGNKSLSRTCPHCKTADKRSLGEFEEFRTVFGPSEKLISKPSEAFTEEDSEDEKMDEFNVSAMPHEDFVKSTGSKLSYVTVKTLAGKSLKICAKVNQTTNLTKSYFQK